MPSIFIWKADTPNTSKNNIRMYLGSNWMMEDNECSSKNYKYISQTVIPGLNDSVITIQFEKMPHDWVGSDLLEVVNVPYECIKSDNFGTLERIGSWMRFTSNFEVDDNTALSQFNSIKTWFSSPATYNKTDKSDIKRITPRANQNRAFTPLNIQQVHNNFAEFYNKYASNNTNMSNIHMPHNRG